MVSKGKIISAISLMFVFVSPTLLAATSASSGSCTTIKIMNSLPAMKGCNTKYCPDQPPSISVFSYQGGQQVINAGQTVDFKPSAFSDNQVGVQLNVARLGTGRTPCDNVCGRLEVNLATGAAKGVTPGKGECGSNSGAAKATYTVNGSKSGTTCTVVFISATSNPPTLCNCPYGAYPCSGSSGPLLK